MGSPRYVAGLSYNVGTCAAQGVSGLVSSRTVYFPVPKTSMLSLLHARLATSAVPTQRPRSRVTATQPTHTAAPETTPTVINSMATSMDSRPWPLSVLDSAAVAMAAMAERPRRRPVAPFRPVTAALFTASAVARDGRDPRAALREPARRLTSGTLSVCNSGLGSVRKRDRGLRNGTTPSCRYIHCGTMNTASVQTGHHP